MLELKKGRPFETDHLLQKEIDCYNLLDNLNIPYWHVHHEAHMTMEACQEVDKILDATICKNLFLCNRQQTDFYLLLIPGEKHFATKELSHQLGVSRLSFAKDVHMQQYLNLTPGSVTILGLQYDTENKVRLLIDEDLLQQEYFACHPNINTGSLKFLTSDLINKVIPALHHTPTIVQLNG